MKSRRMELMELFAGQQWRQWHREKTCGHGVGGGGRYGERNMETYTTTCEIESQQEFALWLKELKLGLGNNLEWWDEEEGGREGQDGEDFAISMADSCWCLAETNTITIKYDSSIKN